MVSSPDKLLPCFLIGQCRFHAIGFLLSILLAELPLYNQLITPLAPLSIVIRIKYSHIETTMSSWSTKERNPVVVPR